MGGVLFGLLVVLAVGAAVILQRTGRAVRTLRDRTVTELTQLKLRLESRHLILSHLTDSLPSSCKCDDWQGVDVARRQAEESLQRIDPASPQQSDICNFSKHEQELVGLIQDLIQLVEADEKICSIQSVAGCLEGLHSSSNEIMDNLSTYNTAAIAYSTCRESSWIARLLSAGDFALCDLDPHNSGIGRVEPVTS